MGAGIQLFLLLGVTTCWLGPSLSCVLSRPDANIGNSLHIPSFARPGLGLGYETMAMPVARHSLWLCLAPPCPGYACPRPMSMGMGHGYFDVYSWLSTV